MKALRVALGIVAVLLLAAASVGAFVSIRINWEFATTLGRNPTWAFWVAMSLAAVEVCRIALPFVAKGLKEAGVSPRTAQAAFVLFTAVSVSSAFGFFSTNRIEAGGARSIQLAETQAVKAELKSINKRLAVELGRSPGEVEADLKVTPKGAQARAALEKEAAAWKQRAEDLARVKELGDLKVWQTAVSTADGQADGLAAAVPWFDKAATASVVAALITLVIVACIELLVGYIPFAAIMLLVWACSRPPEVAPPPPKPVAATAPPTDHVVKFCARCIARTGAVQFRPLYEAYLSYCVPKGWQPLSEPHFKPAMYAALGSKPPTKKQKQGVFWQGVSLRPQLVQGALNAAA